MTLTNSQSPARTLAVTHQAGPVTRMLVVRAEGGTCTLLDARSVDGPPSAAFAEIMSRHALDRVIRIAPGSSTVCRVGSVTTGGEAETLAALDLIAEAILPNDIPPHRCRAAVLPHPVTSSTSADARVLATAWFGEAAMPYDGTGVKASRGRHARAVPETWITPAGALAGLVPPGEIAAFADDAGRAISIIANGPSQVVARQLVGDSSSPQAWRASIDSAVRESAAVAGLDSSVFEGLIAPNSVPADHQAALFISQRVRSAMRAAIKPAPTDDRWFGQFGLCLGAALVATAGPTARILADLTAEAPKVRLPAPIRAASWLAEPRRARIIITAAAAALILSPVGIAFARHAVLKAKTSRVEEQKTSREQIQRQAALYSQLEVSRWPVTKLLSDISAATPVGVSADTINLSTEMGLRIAGRAESQALVNTLQANLNATRLFRDIKIGRRGSLDTGEVEFDITAQVASPHNKVIGTEDFSAQTLAVRLHGPGADNTREAPAADRSRARRPGRSDDSSRDTATASRRPAGDAPPAALTDEQINAMDSSTSMKEWASRRSYVQKNPTLDTQTKDRLNDEATKLREQMRKAQSSGASSGGAAK